MPLLSDRESFDRAAMQRVNQEFREIGEIVLVLTSKGQLIVGDGLNSVDQCGYFVKWQELGGSRAVIKRNADLLVALREVERVVNRV